MLRREVVRLDGCVYQKCVEMLQRDPYPFLIVADTIKDPLQPSEQEKMDLVASSSKLYGKLECCVPIGGRRLRKWGLNPNRLCASDRLLCCWRVGKKWRPTTFQTERKHAGGKRRARKFAGHCARKLRRQVAEYIVAASREIYMGYGGRDTSSSTTGKTFKSFEVAMKEKKASPKRLGHKFCFLNRMQKQWKSTSKLSKAEHLAKLRAAADEWDQMGAGLKRAHAFSIDEELEQRAKKARVAVALPASLKPFRKHCDMGDDMFPVAASDVDIYMDAMRSAKGIDATKNRGGIRQIADSILPEGQFGGRLRGVVVGGIMHMLCGPPICI
jgi:hypothetical protein